MDGLSSVPTIGPQFPLKKGQDIGPPIPGEDAKWWEKALAVSPALAAFSGPVGIALGGLQFLENQYREATPNINRDYLAGAISPKGELIKGLGSEEALHQRISSKNRLFHQTHPGSLDNILNEGIVFKPPEYSDYAGVSTARVPAHGESTGYVTSRPITLEVEKKVPTRPIAELAFQKTVGYPSNKDLIAIKNLSNEFDVASKELLSTSVKDPTWKVKHDKFMDLNQKLSIAREELSSKPNPHFEYEERTRAKVIPPQDIKAIHVDKQKLGAVYATEAHDIMQRVKKRADEKGIPVFLHDKTSDLKNWQAARSRLAKPYSEGGEIDRPILGLVGEKGPEIVQRGSEQQLISQPKLMGLGKGYKVIPL